MSTLAANPVNPQDQLIDAGMRAFLTLLRSLFDVIQFSGQEYNKSFRGTVFHIRCAAGVAAHPLPRSWFEVILSYGGKVVYRTGRHRSSSEATDDAERFMTTFNG